MGFRALKRSNSQRRAISIAPLVEIKVKIVIETRTKIKPDAPRVYEKEKKMFLIFLVLTALVGIYFFLKATEELPQILTLTAVAISVFLALTMAPWEAQLLMIILLLLVTRKVSWRKPGHLG